MNIFDILDKKQKTKSNNTKSSEPVKYDNSKGMNFLCNEVWTTTFFNYYKSIIMAHAFNNITNFNETDLEKYSKTENFLYYTHNTILSPKQLEKVEYYIKKGALVNSILYQDSANVLSLLSIAVFNKDLRFIELLIKNGADPYQIYVHHGCENTPMEFIKDYYSEPHLSMVLDIFNKNGIKIYSNVHSQKSDVLFLMLQNKEKYSTKEIIKYIKNNEINPNHSVNRTTLLELCAENSLECLFALLDKGADINQPSKDGSHIIEKIKLPDNKKQLFNLCDKLLEYGFDVNYRNKKYGFTLLASASKLKNPLLFEWLLDHNVDPYIFSYWGYDLWIYQKGDCDEIQNQLEKLYPKSESLVKKRSQIRHIEFETKQDFYARINSPYQKYFLANTDYLAEIILNEPNSYYTKQLMKDFSLNKEFNAEGLCNNMLKNAVENKQYEIAEILLKKGANPNAFVDDNFLMVYAIKNQDKPMIELLCKHGARPYKFFYNKSFIELNKLDTKIVNFLKQVTALSYDDNTPNDYQKAQIEQQKAIEQVDEVFNKVFKDFDGIDIK